MSTTISILPGELWWGGATHHGLHMPFDAHSSYAIDLAAECVGNQTAPFFVSSMGRTIWCDDPFAIRIENGVITTDRPVLLDAEHGTLPDAYRAASRRYFPPEGPAPEPLFYTHPQYNTWAELTYHQSQQSILAYARAILGNGYPPGILMIDDTWQEDYGVWRFHPGRFPDPRGMLAELHAIGFKVMLWIVPYLSPDSMTFREAPPEALLRRRDGRATVLEWWNGYGAALDMTTEPARQWLVAQLESLQALGVDGFKFDGGSVAAYRKAVADGETDADPCSQTMAYNTFAGGYRFSEVKDTFKAGGKPYNQRLRDKDHAWEGEGLACLIPDAIALSLTGHAFVCPDMVGGGEWTCFTGEKPLDQELVVRFAQASALFPMMQFSVAPWRVLSPENNARVKQTALLHAELGDELYALVRQAVKSGEPVLRPLCYNYPGHGYERIADQFMLGEDLLVAPVIKKGVASRTVVFPPGSWCDAQSQTYTGPSVCEVSAPLDVLPWFRRSSG